MSDEKKSAGSREQELDDFWDISALIPPKKTPSPRAHTPVTLTEINVASDSTEKMPPEQSHTRLTRIAPPNAAVGSSSEASREERTTPQKAEEDRDTVITRFIPPHTPEPIKKSPDPDDEYTLQGSMLHTVRIFRWKTSYQYYEDFCLQATALYHRRGEPCQPVSFFSYVPQYSQMNRAQLAWYLYWRDGVRRGEIMPADYSYILLYIYEIINLADTMDLHVGQQQLCILRKAFRDTYPRLGHLLNEWICDYSLIHHLPPPELDDLSAVSDCTLKEFYVPRTDASLRYAAALMAFGSNYAYTKSKFAVGENRALYDRHMLGALCACIADSGEVGERMAGANLEESKLIRDAYTGALCSHRVKRRIEIDYCSFARSHELRILVTDIMKYTENRLRAYLGVKSRLGLYALPQSFRDCVDRYMRTALPARERTIRPEPRQEYDVLYDVPKTEFSAARAAEIEASSWNTTERLIAAFDTPDRAEAPDPAEERPAHREDSVCEEPAADLLVQPEPVLAQAEEGADEDQLLLNELGDLCEFINYALRSDAAAQRDFARARGEMIDSVADRINEISADILGDIVLEESDNGGYTVIDDYRAVFENKP